MLGTCVLSMVVEVHTYKNVTDKSKDYKVKMLDKQIHITLADLTTKSKLLEAAKAKAKEAQLLAEEHKQDAPGVDESNDRSANAPPSCFKRRGTKKGDMEKFENPITEDDNVVATFEDEDQSSFEDEDEPGQRSDVASLAAAASDSSLPEEDPGATDTSSHTLLLVNELAQLKRTTDERNAQAMKEVNTTKRLLAKAQAELKATDDKAQAELKAAKEALQQTQDRNDRLSKEVERLKQVQVAAVESSGTKDAVDVQLQPEVKATSRQTKDEAGEARVGAISTRVSRDAELGRPEFHPGELLAATQKLTVRTSWKKGSHHVAQLKNEDTFEVLDVVIETYLQVQTQTVKGKDLAKTGWVKPLDRSGNPHVKRVALDPTA